MITEEAKLKAVAPWFGGKRTLAKDVVAEFGNHRSYWEPFCGSLSILLAKPISPSETVNDLHGPLTTMVKVIASDDAPKLYEQLQRVMFCDELFLEIRGRLQRNECKDDLDIAFCFFVECWMGRNGIAGTRSANTAFCVRYTSNGGDPATRFRSAVDSIPAWHKRLRAVWVLNQDALEMLERVEDKAGTLIYCDPPYVEKGARYLHDFKDDDHQRLADVLKRFVKTRVVVSYYDHPKLDVIYSGWTKTHLDAVKFMGSTSGQTDKGTREAAPEILFINGPSLIEKKGLFSENGT